jgi:hypothetical protein
LFAQNGYYQDSAASILLVQGSGRAYLGRADQAGSVTIAGGAVQFNHTSGYATLEIDGAFTHSGGTLFFHVHGNTSNDNDQINAVGAFTTTGGNLDVQADGVLMAGKAWAVIVGASRSGTYDAQHVNFHGQALTLSTSDMGILVNS